MRRFGYIGGLVKEVKDPSEPPELDPNRLTQSQLATVFMPNPEDIEFSRQFRGQANQIAAIYQRRYTDAFGRPPKPREFMGGAMEFIAIVTGRDPRCLDGYAPSPWTLWKQQPKVVLSLGYRRFDAEAARRLEGWLYDQARSNDDQERLLKLARHKLRMDRVLKPGVFTLLRIVRRARGNAEEWIHETIAGQINRTSRENLDALLIVDPETRGSRFEWIKHPVGISSAKTLGIVLDKIHAIRETNIHLVDFSLLSLTMKIRLARQTKGYSSWFLKDFPEEKRYTHLVCFLKEQEEFLIDVAAEMFCQVVPGIARKTAKAVKEALADRFEQLAEGSLELDQGWQIYFDPAVEDPRVRHAIYAKIPQPKLKALVEKVRDLAGGVDGTYAQSLMRHGSNAKPSLRRFVHMMQFVSEDPRPAVWEALMILREALGEDLEPRLPDKLPTDFVPKRLRKSVKPEKGEINKPLWEMATMVRLAESLLGCGIWVDGGKQFGDIEEHLCVRARWPEKRKEACAQWGWSLLPIPVLPKLLRRLEQIIVQFAEDAPNNPFIDIRGRRWVQKGTVEQVIPRRVVKLKAEVEKRLRLFHHIALPDLLRQVDAWIEFSRHYRSGRTRPEELEDELVRIYAVLVAEACNWDLTGMAETTPGMTYRKLATVRDWFFRDEANLAVVREAVKARQALPITRRFGDEDRGVSDAQKVGSRAKLKEAGYYPKRFGTKRAVSQNTHMTDTYIPFHVKIIRPVREMPFAIDGLLHNEVGVSVRKHVSDTGGYAEPLFGLCWFFGIEFEPRIKNLPSQKLYAPPGMKIPDNIRKRFDRHRLDTQLIVEEWDNILRIMAAIADSSLTATVLCQRISQPGTTIRTFLAMRELGRLLKTIFILEYYSKPEMRTAIHGAMQKIENYHSLLSAIRIGKRGEFSDADYDRLSSQASSLMFVANAIHLWNSVMISRILEELRAEGFEFEEEDLRHLSPALHGHVTMHGQYVFDLTKPVDLKVYQDAQKWGRKGS